MIEPECSCNAPYVSVIVPCFNDAQGIRDTLTSLARQDYPKDRMEVIVVDNNSTDGTPRIIDEFADRIINFRHLVERDRQSSYAARNRGIACARGAIVAFIDTDMSVGPEWLSQISMKFKDSDVIYLACGVTIYEERASVFAAFNRMKGFPIDEYVQHAHFAPTCCLAVRKTVFEEVGMFDARVISGGDYEFGTRVYRAGKPLHYAPEIRMNHPARTSLRQLLKKYFRVGRGLQQLANYYPDRYRETFKHLLNPLHLLPSMPTKFIISLKHNSIWRKASYTDKLLLYGIDWGLRVSKYAGHVYEKQRFQAHI